MTVSQLIRELKKMPKDAKVAWKDHDGGFGEINGTVDCVTEADKDEVDYLRANGKEIPEAGLVLLG